MATNQKQEDLGAIIEKKVDSYLKSKVERSKTFLYGFFFFLTLIITWSLYDKGDFIRLVHEKIFPSNNKEVLITAYSNTFSLKASEETKGKHATASLTFYSGEGDRVDYYLKMSHQFYESEEKQREIYLELDQNKVLKKPFKDHAGGFRKLKISEEIDNKSEPNIHNLVFRLNSAQKDYLKLKDELTITCIILVYGKQ